MNMSDSNVARLSINNDFPGSSETDRLILNNSDEGMDDDIVSPFGPPSPLLAESNQNEGSLKSKTENSSCISRTWHKIRHFIVPIEIMSFLSVFSVTFAVQLFQQYQYQSMFPLLHDQNDSETDCSMMSNNYTHNFNAKRITVNHYRVAMALAYLVPSAIVTPFIGPLSDCYGRKPLLFIVITAQLFLPIVGLIAVYFNGDAWFLFLGAFAAGITGGLGSLLALLYSYVSDVTPSTWLTVRMGTLEASILLASATSTFIANSVLYDMECNFIVPMWTLFGFVIASVIYAMILPKSTLNKGLDMEHEPEKFMDFKAFKLLCCKSYQSRKLFEVWLVIVALLISFFSTIGLTQFSLYFLLNSELLQWKYSVIGFYHATSAIAHLSVLAVILPVLVIFKIPDILISFVGVLGACGGSVFIALLSNQWQMFLAGIIMGFEVLVMPGLRARIATIYDEKVIGGVFSIITSLQLLSTILASGIFHEVYSPGGVADNLAYSDDSAPFDPPRPPWTLYWAVAGLWAITGVILIFIFFVKRNVKDKKVRFFYNKRLFRHNSYGGISVSTTSSNLRRESSSKNSK